MSHRNPFSLSRVSLKLLLLLPVLVAGTLADVCAETITVRDAAGLRKALQAPPPGTLVRIEPGEYQGGYFIQRAENLTVEAADPQRPPVFAGGSAGWHFSECSGLTLRHLQIRGQKHNGINLDDGGNRGGTMQRVALEHLDVSDIGPTGNVDAIKCSGIQDLKISNCRLSGWGGEGIDLVGCRQVSIVACQLTGKTGYSQSAGIQCKGGTTDVRIEGCRFQNAGQRPINAGGSTGLEFFRPRDVTYEASGIRISGNEIVGSLCACAFVGVDGAEFVDNTVMYPEKWVFRILQETTDARFVHCRNVRIERNRIVFRRAQVSTEVNIGAGTAPETFRFVGNSWYAEDRPDRSKPQLPTAETDGIYGQPAEPRR